MNQLPAPVPGQASILAAMAARYGMAAQNFEATLRATVVPSGCSREQLAAFLVVAHEYGLNPLTKEIYAFPGKSGGIQPIVSIDGWVNLMNSHPAMDGIDFRDHMTSDGKLTAITAIISRKDRTKPVTVTEYLAECYRPTDTWQKWPRRMLRHKALIQCARYAFGFSGIIDQDEYERIRAIPERPMAPAQVIDEPHDPKTGEIVSSQSAPPQPAATEAPALSAAVPDEAGDSTIIEDIRTALQEAAMQGLDALAEEWGSIHPLYQRLLDAEKQRLKAIATEADQQAARRS